MPGSLDSQGRFFDFRNYAVNHLNSLDTMAINNAVGSVSLSSTSGWRVTGTGSLTGGTTDSFFFVYKQLSDIAGDVSVQLNVKRFLGSLATSKAGEGGKVQ